MSTTNVKVCVRVRPQVAKEIIEQCKICTSVTPNEPQIYLGNTKAFTFDNVFDIGTDQLTIFETCVEPLIDGALDGYNATVLAYGQTGSGKTHTMGTGFDMRIDKGNLGIIPRAVSHLFNGIEKRRNNAINNNEQPPEFTVTVSFLEIYNEQIIDLLLDDSIDPPTIKIHEDTNGQIFTSNTTAKPVKSSEMTLNYLKKGSLSRSTASTNMNSQSSRSHAIFTININQQCFICDKDKGGAGDIQTFNAKLHFVDLAGSERLERTGATGDRAKEAISINSGLLALGNVISALGDKRKVGCHVPYRDSKLTRLLQDSLGGNSQTLMMACISPSDRDFIETLNTLRYANRAKNIKNRVVANTDKASETISRLRKQIAELELELLEFRQGKRLVTDNGTEINDMYHENNLLTKEVASLKTINKNLQQTNERLMVKNSELSVEKEMCQWSSNGNNGNGNESDEIIKEMVSKYMTIIQELEAKIIELEGTISDLKKRLVSNSRSPAKLRFDEDDNIAEDLLKVARDDVARKKKRMSHRSPQQTKDIDTKEMETSEYIPTTTTTNGNIDDDNCDIEISEEDEQDQAENEIDPETEARLSELSDEIDIKERLINELEKTQRRMTTLQQQYEYRLEQLSTKIQEIERERDSVLAKISNTNSTIGQDKVKRIKEEYERKLNVLQEEKKKFKAAEREHIQQMRANSKNETRLKSLKNEVDEMKKQKVSLIKKMREIAARHREEDARNTAKISKLTKSERQKDLKIRNLENEASRYKNLVKRKDDELNAMKRQIKPMSDAVAGRLCNSRNKAINNNGKSINNATITTVTPRIIKQKWEKIETSINKTIEAKKQIAQNESQMNRFLERREELVTFKKDTKNRLDNERFLNGDSDVAKALEEELASIDELMTYLNQNIDECQDIIIQLEEECAESGAYDVGGMLSGVGVSELRYLFEKLLLMTLKTCDTNFKEDLRSSMEEGGNDILQLLMNTTYINGHLDETVPTVKDSQNYQQLQSINQNNQQQHQQSLRQNQSPSRPQKFRRLTKTPQELLFEQSRTSSIGAVEPRKKN